MFASGRDVIGVAEIRRVIPHRFPVLLIDRVSEVEPGLRLVAHKAISGREPGYEFLGEDAAPAEYAYPISLLLESWAQAALLLARWEQPNPDVRTGRVELLTGVRNVELLAPVYPGDVLEHRVELIRAFTDATIFGGSSFVGGHKILEVGQFTVAAKGTGVLQDQG